MVFFKSPYDASFAFVQCYDATLHRLEAGFFAGVNAFTSALRCLVPVGTYGCDVWKGMCMISIHYIFYWT